MATLRASITGVLRSLKWVSKKTKNDGKHPWKIPSTIATSSAYKVKITATIDNKLTDTSNKNFTITKTGGGGTGTLSVTQPNGGQKWKTGKKYAIKWNKGNAGAYVKIQLLKSNNHYKWITKKTKNDGKHPWKVPSSVATGSAYKVKITSRTKKTVTDTSNANFTITKVGGGAGTLTITTPNGGENWATGKTTVIKWNKGNAGAHVKIQLLKSGKHYKWITNKTKNDGKHPWKIPASVVTSGQYKIKVTSSTNNTITDTSNSNFTITKPMLKVKSPNGGEDFDTGDTINIQWDTGSAGSAVTIKLYKSGGYSETISSYTSNDGSYSWTIPSSVDTSSQYKIRVGSYGGTESDSSDGNFTITKPKLKVKSPNGGEDFDIGDTINIKWETGSTSSYVNIDLYKSGASSDEIAYYTSNDGSYSWTIPSSVDTSSQYKIRIESVWSSESDSSDNNFSITRPPIELLSPNGGESWTAGTYHNIKWTGGGTGYVIIDLYKGGDEYTNISNYGSGGSYSWYISSWSYPKGNDYRIKVTDKTDYSDSDISGSYFTIKE